MSHLNNLYRILNNAKIEIENSLTTIDMIQISEANKISEPLPGDGIESNLTSQAVVVSVSGDVLGVADCYGITKQINKSAIKRIWRNGKIFWSK